LSANGLLCLATRDRIYQNRLSKRDLELRVKRRL
jgi:hypothetical protein